MEDNKSEQMPEDSYDESYQDMFFICELCGTAYPDFEKRYYVGQDMYVCETCYYTQPNCKDCDWERV